MKWFRLYSSVLQDPKVQRLSPALFKHWINLLCLANESEPRGLLPCVEDIAFALRVKPSEAATMLTQLRRAGLVDQTPEGRDFPHNWPQRQRKSDDIAARVDEHRKREAAKQGHSSDTTAAHVTLHETLLKRSVDTDTDTDTEVEIDRDVTDDSESDGNSIIVADADASGDDDSAPHAPDADDSLSEQEPAPASKERKPLATFAPDAPAMRLAIKLRDGVLTHTPTAQDANKARHPSGLQAWARKLDTLMQDPRRAPPDVEAVIAYALADERFWQAKVLNPDKVKRHFDTINSQRLADERRHANGRHAANAENGRYPRQNPMGGSATPARFTPEYYARAAGANGAGAAAVKRNGG